MSEKPMIARTAPMTKQIIDGVLIFNVLELVLVLVLVLIVMRVTDVLCKITVLLCVTSRSRRVTWCTKQSRAGLHLDTSTHFFDARHKTCCAMNAGDDDDGLPCVLPCTAPEIAFAILRVANALDALLHGSLAMFVHMGLTAPGKPTVASAVEELFEPRDMDFLVPLNVSVIEDIEEHAKCLCDVVRKEFSRWHCLRDVVVTGHHTYFCRAELVHADADAGAVAYAPGVYVFHLKVFDKTVADFTFVPAAERRAVESQRGFKTSSIVASLYQHNVAVKLVSWAELFQRLKSLRHVNKKHSDRFNALTTLKIQPVARNFLLYQRYVYAPTPKAAAAAAAVAVAVASAAATKLEPEPEPEHEHAHARAPEQDLDRGRQLCGSSMHLCLNVSVINVAGADLDVRVDVDLDVAVNVTSCGIHASPFPSPFPSPLPSSSHVPLDLVATTACAVVASKPVAVVSRTTLQQMAAAVFKTLDTMHAKLVRDVDARLEKMARRIATVIETACLKYERVLKLHVDMRDSLLRAQVEIASVIGNAAQLHGSWLAFKQGEAPEKLMTRFKTLILDLARRGVEPFATSEVLDTKWDAQLTMQGVMRKVVFRSFFVFQRALAIQLGLSEARRDVEAVRASEKYSTQAVHDFLTTLKALAAGSKFDMTCIERGAVSADDDDDGIGVGVVAGAGAGAGADDEDDDEDDDDDKEDLMDAQTEADVDVDVDVKVDTDADADLPTLKIPVGFDVGMCHVADALHAVAARAVALSRTGSVEAAIRAQQTLPSSVMTNVDDMSYNVQGSTTTIQLDSGCRLKSAFVHVPREGYSDGCTSFSGDMEVLTNIESLDSFTAGRVREQEASVSAAKTTTTTSTSSYSSMEQEAPRACTASYVAHFKANGTVDVTTYLPQPNTMVHHDPAAVRDITCMRKELERMKNGGLCLPDGAGDAVNLFPCQMIAANVAKVLSATATSIASGQAGEALEVLKKLSASGIFVKAALVEVFAKQREAVERSNRTVSALMRILNAFSDGAAPTSVNKRGARKPRSRASVRP